jgi:DNA-binding MarR family transcriptional regulator
MVDKSAVVAGKRAEDRVSEGALETSRLLVEFLHTAYATRHMEAGEASGVEAGQGDNERTHGTASPAVSTHAVRAAIHVYQHGERTVGQLASGLGISYGWASRVVEELEAAHYLVRERDTDDRRVVRVRLNPDAVDEVERAYSWRGRAVEGALEPLSDSEREAVRIFLRRVIDLLREGQPERP